MKSLSLTLILACTLALTGCQPIEKTARDSVAAAKGYLDSAKAHHPECATNGGHGANCDIIARGVGAKDAVIDAVQVYCASSSYDSGSPCSPNKDAEPKLKAALQSLDQIMTDVRKLGGSQ